MITVNGVLAPFGVLLFLTVIILLTYIFARRRQLADRSVRLAGASAPTDHDTSDGEDDDPELGLNEATILSYPRLQYPQAARDIDADDGSNNSCSICLIDYQETDTVRVLPECKHFYHVKCVDPWLKLHSTCPNCRRQLVTPSDGSSASRNPLSRREYSSRFTLIIAP